jgi:uncharacterized membrane protein YbhN (UPF0104 family)
MNPRRWRVLRVVGSIAMLAFLVMILPAGSLRAALGNTSPQVLAVVLTIFVVCHLAAALKWRMLMGQLGDVSVTKAFRAHFTGLVGNLSPLGMIGGDIVRATVAINGSARPASIMVTSVVDRAVDTAALLILTLIGFLWIGGQSDIGRAVLWGGLALVTAGVLASGVAWVLLRRADNPRLAGFRAASQLLVDEPGLIAGALLLSVSIQGVLISANAYIGANLGVESSLGAWLVAWPAAKLAAYIPIGIAGIGIRESAMVALLGPLGGAAGPVLAASLLWDGVLIVGAVVGWFALCVLPGLRPAARRFQNP